MEGGFRFLLAGIVLIALAFSLMSVWPALTEPRPRKVTLQTPQVIQPVVAPPVTSPPSQSSQPAQATKRPRQPGQIAPLQANPPGLVATAQPQSVEVAGLRDWIYTTKRVTLLKEPGGDPHRADSINHSELEIMGGTRLTRVRSEDGWLLVQSPSKLYGWLHENDVSTRAPVATDTKWSLYPSSQASVPPLPSMR